MSINRFYLFTYEINKFHHGIYKRFFALVNRPTFHEQISIPLSHKHSYLILQGFDQGKITGMILIDLQKAFDTIDHKVLLDKLVYMGFSD